jgi:hypothetical protein
LIGDFGCVRCERTRREARAQRGLCWAIFLDLGRQGPGEERYEEIQIMNHIQFLTDDQGKRTAAVVDFRKHKDLWEDIADVLVSQSRRHEKRIPIEKVEADLIKLRAVCCVARYRLCPHRKRGKRIEPASRFSGGSYCWPHRETCRQSPPERMQEAQRRHE